MYRPLPTLSGLTLTLALAACMTTPPAEAPSPLRLGAKQDVAYHGVVVSGSFDLADEIVQLGDVVATERIVDLQASFVTLSENEARELGLLAVGGWLVDRAEARARLQQPAWQARVIAAQRLSLYSEQRGNVAVVNQRAYVRAFELSAEDHVLEADPVVDVLSDGALLVVQGAPVGEEAVALTLALHLADIQELGEVEASVPGSFTPVTIQQPVLSQQRLTSELVLNADEALVLVALDPGGAGRMLVLVEAEQGSVADLAGE